MALAVGAVAPPVAAAPAAARAMRRVAAAAPPACRSLCSARLAARLPAARRAHAAAPRGARLRVAAAAAAGAAKEEQKKAREMLGFPFVKIVGQEDMKLALMLNVVDSRIGGVLIMGDRGTGKSVAVRALVDLLPDIEVIDGDNYNSDPADPSLMGPEARDAYKAGATPRMTTRRIPMIEVPLGATEDRICGTIDIERALSDGVKAFEPGLLAKANRGILFVDEVNLLDDSLVDVVLDSAASGWNTVEREGISILHPAKFIMIGSGNPEEGELRPQLLDRFGMAVTVGTIYDLEARVDLVQNRIAYEKDPEAFQSACAKETEELRQKLAAARARVESVKISRELTLKISEVCSLINIDGLRGDIVVNRTAKALAALEGAEEVTQMHIARIIPLCLAHRLRKDPLDPIDSGSKVALAYQRVFNPKKKEDKAAEPAAAAPAGAPAAPAGAKPAAAPAKPAEKKKAGAWGGLGR